jgi:phage head maturation protease
MTVTFEVVTPWSTSRWPSQQPASPGASQRAADAILRISEILGDRCHYCSGRYEIPDGGCSSCSTAAVEYRSAVATVDHDQRIITIIAAPYEQEAVVMFRGRLWTEIFVRNAFNGIEQRASKIRVNRDHDRGRTIGKVVRFDPRHRQGLLTEIRVAKTILGDESLALASEDMLSASVAFSVPAGGEQLDHHQRIRRITTAVLDHIALVESPAYEGAQVLAVG